MNNIIYNVLTIMAMHLFFFPKNSFCYNFFKILLYLQLVLRFFCISLFQISALLLFQLAGGERGRASKYICDTVSPPNTTVTPLKAISRELECREPNGLISGLVAMPQFWRSEILFVWLSSWHQGGLFYGLLSNQMIKLFKCKEGKKKRSKFLSPDVAGGRWIFSYLIKLLLKTCCPQIKTKRKVLAQSARFTTSVQN